MMINPISKFRSVEPGIVIIILVLMFLSSSGGDY